MTKHHPRLKDRVCAAVAALCLFAATITSAVAGRSCEDTKLTPQAVTQGLALAERTLRRLDESGAQVVALARSGQDLSAYHLRYSHMGLAYKDGPIWRVLHKLNQCGSAHGSVYRQGLGDFFLDAPHDYVAGVVVLSPAVQARLLPLLRDERQTAAIHTHAYSMVAYPWSQTYQQSNQWAIETLALAMGGPDVKDRASAQRWLQSSGFVPTELHVPAFKRLGARLTAANVSFDDHPATLRFSGRIRTVTVDAVFAWLKAADLGQAEWTVR